MSVLLNIMNQEQKVSAAKELKEKCLAKANALLNGKWGDEKWYFRYVSNRQWLGELSEDNLCIFFLLVAYSELDK